MLGHVQRGGTPTAFDRVLATRFGLHAIDAVDAGEWGKMTALRGTDIELVELAEATEELKTVPRSTVLRGRGLLWLDGRDGQFPRLTSRALMSARLRVSASRENCPSL